MGETVPSNPESCSLMSTGQARILSYSERHKIDGDPEDPRRPETGEDGIRLASVSPEASEKENFYQTERDRSVCDVASSLMKWYKKDEVTKELKKLESKIGKETMNF